MTCQDLPPEPILNIPPEPGNADECVQGVLTTLGPNPSAEMLKHALHIAYNIGKRDGIWEVLNAVLPNAMSPCPIQT